MIKIAWSKSRRPKFFYRFHGRNRFHGRSINIIDIGRLRIYW